MFETLYRELKTRGLGSLTNAEQSIAMEANFVARVCA